MQIDTRASSIRFVYPFTFSEVDFDLRANAIANAHWQGRKGLLKVWRNDKFVIDDLLPHVAEYLNPRDSDNGDTPPTARLWCLDDNVLNSRLGGGIENAGAKWSLLPRKSRAPIPFGIESVQLAIFSVGVGFLTVCAVPTADCVDDWLDFLHYFRYTRGQHDLYVEVAAQRQTGIAPSAAGQAASPILSPFFPEPAGGLEKHPDGKGHFYEILEALLLTATPTPPTLDSTPLIPQSAIRNPQSPWWEEIFVPGQFLPFATLYVDDVPQEETAKLLYRVRNFFHVGQGEHGSDHDLSLEHPSLLPYAQNQWFVFSLEGGAFVACDAPRTDFFRNVMPSHLDNQYFLLFLLAVQQRFVLMMLSQEIATHWMPDTYGGTGRGDDVETRRNVERIATFTRIRDKLLWFAARGYFTQVMQQEHHHRCYRQWQETFQVPQLYQEISEAVRYMHDVSRLEQAQHLERLAEGQQQKVNRLEQRLSRVAWVLGVPALSLTYLQTLGEQHWLFSGLVAVISLVIGFALFWVLDYFSAERRKMRNK
jgi:hypothetical protein